MGPLFRTNNHGWIDERLLLIGWVSFVDIYQKTSHEEEETARIWLIFNLFVHWYDVKWCHSVENWNSNANQARMIPMHLWVLFWHCEMHAIVPVRVFFHFNDIMLAQYFSMSFWTQWMGEVWMPFYSINNQSLFLKYDEVTCRIRSWMTILYNHFN